MSQIAQQLANVRRRIQQAATLAGREAAAIQLLAVSKTQPLARIQAAIEAGQYAFGESYVQEAIPKIDALALTHADIEWHFIGPIQANKTAAIARHFSWVHSLDRLKIAQRLSEQRPAHLPALHICIQVNISGESSKSGIEAHALPELVQAVQALPGLHLRGLMTVPAPSEDAQAQRHPFAKLRELLQTLNNQGAALDTLSMGMSQDLEAAVAEGATIVRVGTDIFGARR
jgi:pyridoxal phosphate enzyme (YggS family)